VHQPKQIRPPNNEAISFQTVVKLTYLQSKSCQTMACDLK
jgi:hypothetical protein